MTGENISELFHQVALDYLENKINHLESLDDMVVNVSVIHILPLFIQNIYYFSCTQIHPVFSLTGF
jgi:hypothetical protein